MAVEAMTCFVPWLANLNIKRNVMSIFVNKKYRVIQHGTFELSDCFAYIINNVDALPW